MVMHCYILLSLGCSVHHLYVLFAYSGVVLIWGYLWITGLEEKHSGELDYDFEFHSNRFLNVTSNYCLVLVVMTYRMQKYTIDLFIKNRVSN